MIQLSELTKSFADRTLLDHVTWQLADRERVGYRFRVRTEKGPYLVEQQAYLSPSDDGRISAGVRACCSPRRLPR